jgi:endonuclease/exonuclease/phosphatase family metal-dependent hydrolase
MRRRVRSCVWFVRALSLLVFAWWPQSALAQTTVVLSAPDSQVVDATIRGGSYANTNYGSSVLTTRASSTLDYARRALLKFDTENTIPAGATIQSATLTLTIKTSNPLTRTLSAYRVGSSWDEGSTTWTKRRTDQYWGTSGGDLTGMYGQATATATAGSKVTLNVTTLVQATVKGTYGSRYTRIGVVDNGSSTSDSYKEYYSSESSDSSLRPRLTVVYGGSSTSTPTTSTPTTSPTPTTSTSGTSTTLKVLQWNVHHGGIGTDGRYDPARVATWIAKINPDIMSLNEVDTTEQLNAIVSSLQSKTGVTWRTSFSGRGNVVLTKKTVDSTSRCVYPDGVRYAAHMKITVNGRPINLWSTHLTVDSASSRLAEIKAMQVCAQSWPEGRIITGDYNMLQSWSEYSSAVVNYSDAWLVAKSLGTAVNYPGNCEGCTRGGRIDYVFTSKGATFLKVKSAQIIDTRDSNGYMASDHKPLVITYTVG